MHSIRASTPNEPQTAVKAAVWSGRIGLQVQSEPVQSFFAGFELSGQAAQGELTLTGPLGNVLGVVRWTPADAAWQSGKEVFRFSSVEALLEKTTGAALPLAGLFDWLEGKPTAVNGWTVDLSQQANGRITATRSDPTPHVVLRMALER